MVANLHLLGTFWMCKQRLPFYVKTVRCADGERLPTLIEATSGLPDFDATLWVVTSLRPKNLASATIEQALRSLVLLYMVFRLEKINFGDRLRMGKILNPGEIEVILKAAKQKSSTNVFELNERELHNKTEKVGKVVSLEKLRMPNSTFEENYTVGLGTLTIRIGYIKAFLNWRVNREIFRTDGERRANLTALRDLVIAEIEAKAPAMKGRDAIGDRAGIDRIKQSRLLDVISVTHPQNPWTKNEFIRARNQVVINMYLALGIRRSELLAMRVSDIKPSMQEVLILRRPDDVNDPRLIEPNTKTRDRVLPMANELYGLVKSYLKMRKDIVRNAGGFLVVSQAGEPLSKSEVNRIFRALDVVDGLRGIVPHILRHSFFENLAEDLHVAKCEDSEILGYLRRLGGWGDNSNSPRRYTKRFAQESAAKAGLTLQKKLFINNFSEEKNE